MAAERSPRYPSIDLKEAITSIGLLYASEGKTELAPDDAARALGFKGLTGPSRGRIGALRKYGLVESGKRGTLRISDRAVTILVEPGDSPDKQRAIQEAALMPELFRELSESHFEASDQAIKAYLIRNKGFTQRGAEYVAESFKRTMEFANLTQTRDNAPVNGSVKLEQESRSQKTFEKEKEFGPGGVLWLKVPFGTTSLTVRVEVAGEALGRAHLEKVIKYLELAGGDLPNLAGERSPS